MSTPLRPLIKPEVLAEMWDVGLSTIYDLLKRKRRPLPGHKLGRAWRIDPQAAAKWLEEEQGAAA